jgi:hypothetical protein
VRADREYDREILGVIAEGGDAPRYVSVTGLEVARDELLRADLELSRQHQREIFANMTAIGEAEIARAFGRVAPENRPRLTLTPKAQARLDRLVDKYRRGKRENWAALTVDGGCSICDAAPDWDCDLVAHRQYNERSIGRQFWRQALELELAEDVHRELELGAAWAAHFAWLGSVELVRSIIRVALLAWRASPAGLELDARPLHEAGDDRDNDPIVIRGRLLELD